MLTFLQIVGGVVVTIILLIIAFFAYVRIRYGKMIDQARQGHEPLQVHLNEDFAPDWIEKGEAAKYLEELKQSGFDIGKAYSIVEMEGVMVQSAFKPPLTATLYFHPLAGNWVDISFQSKESDREVDVTNAPLGETIDTRPETRKLYMKDARVPALIRAVVEEVGEEEGKLVNDSNYRDHFEDAYRKDMVWRCRRGGMTFEEFKATADAGDKKYKDSQIREAYVETKLQELHAWHDAALERVNDLDESWLDGIYDRGKAVFMLPAHGEVEAYIQYIADFGVIDEKQAEKLVGAFSGQSDLQMVARRIFESISTELRPRKLRDIDFPIQGELYEVG